MNASSGWRFRLLGFYSLLGLLYALGLQYGWSHRGGRDWTSLLSVGESSFYRRLIESELTPLSLVSGLGHDGQWSWIVARHPFSPPADLCEPSNTECDPRYRYRRILVPLLAGGAGTFTPSSTFAGLVILSSLGFAILVGSAGGFLSDAGKSPLWLLLLFANPGSWSLLILSVDTAAVGLAMLGLLLWRHNQTVYGTAVFALAALTKETMLLVPIGVALICFAHHRRLEGIRMLLTAALPLFVWNIALNWICAPFAASRGIRNFSFPFVGLISGAQAWPEMETQDLVAAGATLLYVVWLSVMVIRARSLDLFLLAAPWLTLAVGLSAFVWAQGFDAARVLLILAPLILCGRPGFVLRQNCRGQVPVGYCGS